MILWLAILVEGGLLALALLLGWLVEFEPFDHFRWSPADAALGAVATVPLVILYLLGMRWPLGPLRRLKQILEEFIRPLFQSCTWFELALISLLAGLGEETLFRGVVQETLGAWLGSWSGLLLASVLFGLAHSVTPTYAILATLIGLYLGGLCLLTGNLLVVIVTHALYDFVVLALLRRNEAR